MAALAKVVGAWPGSSIVRATASGMARATENVAAKVRVRAAGRAEAQPAVAVAAVRTEAQPAVAAVEMVRPATMAATGAVQAEVRGDGAREALQAAVLVAVARV